MSLAATAQGGTNKAVCSQDASGDAGEGLGPWNPGINSLLPRRYYPLATLLSASNSEVPLSEVEELAVHAGLDLHAISRLKPERLLLHEVLIRVMTELTIADGPSASDLGLNFRRIVARLLSGHFFALADECRRVQVEARSEIARFISKELGFLVPPSEAACVGGETARGIWSFLERRRDRPRAARTGDGRDDQVVRAISRWHALAHETPDPLAAACYGALHKAAGGVLGKQGSLVGHAAIVSMIASDIATNDVASQRIGELLDAVFEAAAQAEGLRLLPSQSRPVVMNTKGASAAGKSSLRPQQRLLAERIGVDWSDFALISPDIWRKQLLDYNALGPARRYAGTLTAHEVEVIDRKLDGYIARRAGRGRRTHMLIDRFRFDSFAPEGAEDSATQLLTRFGSEVYLFFVITPPEATVERAWTRGEMVGRYKAVDDLLAHNVEAYTGFPNLFFRWSASTDKTVQYEFLDNSVCEGQIPRTVAFGVNGEMTILDVEKIADIDRYKHINIGATSPTEIYAAARGGVEANGSKDALFLRECIRRLPCVVLAEHTTGEVYARFRNGCADLYCPEVMVRAVRNPALRTLILELGVEQVSAARDGHRRLPRSDARTLGAWGPT